jgi:hypothetical protein
MGVTRIGEERRGEGEEKERRRRGEGEEKEGGGGGGGEEADGRDVYMRTGGWSQGTGEERVEVSCLAIKTHVEAVAVKPPPPGQGGQGQLPSALWATATRGVGRWEGDGGQLRRLPRYYCLRRISKRFESAWKESGEKSNYDGRAAERDRPTIHGRRFITTPTIRDGRLPPIHSCTSHCLRSTTRDTGQRH